MSILHLILVYDANSLKYSLVLGDTVAESLSENLELLDAPIEALMASSSTFLEGFDGDTIMWVPDTDFSLLTTVPTVPNRLRASGDLVLEAIDLLAKNLKVSILPRLEGTFHPNRFACVHRNCKLVHKARPIELVQIPPRTRLSLGSPM